MEKQAFAGNKVFIIISYVFMSTDNISYARSCQDESGGVAKNGTMRTGYTQALKHSFGIE